MIESQFIVYFFLGIFGLCFGSFLNVLADRLPREETLLGRSHCESCNHILSWKDLFPIISFAVLKGKCRYCRASISFEYPLGELVTAAVFILTYHFSLYSYHTISLHIIHVAIAAVLIIMFLADIRYQIIPDEAQIALFALGVIRLFLLFNTSFSFSLITPYLLGSIVVMLPLLAVFLITKGKGMGFGDVKFAVNMGLLLGMWNGLAALYIAFITGGIIGGFILLTKRGSLKSKIAFGPFLFLGTYLMLFFENEIILLLSRIYRF